MENKLLKLKELDSFIKTIEGVHNCCSEICFDENNCCSVVSLIKLNFDSLELSINIDYIGRVEIEVKNTFVSCDYFDVYIEQLVTIRKHIDDIINKALDVIEA